jgi:hypothetical protein
MKSFRFSSELEKKLSRAAEYVGLTESELVRQTVTLRCDEILGGALDEVWASVVGSVKGGGGRARRTHDAFRALLDTAYGAEKRHP